MFGSCHFCNFVFCILVILGAWFCLVFKFPSCLSGLAKWVSKQTLKMILVVLDNQNTKNEVTKIWNEHHTQVSSPNQKCISTFTKDTNILQLNVCNNYQIWFDYFFYFPALPFSVLAWWTLWFPLFKDIRVEETEVSVTLLTLLVEWLESSLEWMCYVIFIIR